MILQCPACKARYAVPDHAIGANGRTVKCVKCAHAWHVEGVPQAAPVIETAATPETAPAPAAEETAVARTKSRKAKAPTTNLPKKIVDRPATTPVLMGSLAACLLLAVVTSLFVHKPEWFGYPKTQGVTFTELSLQKRELERGMEYAVSGKLVNTTDKEIKPPTVRITLVDKEGNALQYWEPQMPEKIAANDAPSFSFGPLETRFSKADRLVVEMGNSLELNLRDKPGASHETASN